MRESVDDRATATKALGAFLGLTYVVLGIVESTIAIRGSDPILYFWLPALCGGGLLILTGVLKVVRPAWVSIGLVTVGALAGALATAWTIVGPILSITLILLIISRSSPGSASAA